MKKSYSKYLVPLMLTFDVAFIIGVIIIVNDIAFLNVSFLIYITLFWIVSSLFSGFYNVYRNTKIFRIFTLLAVQLIIFLLGYFSYFTIFREGEVVNNQTFIFSTIYLIITVFKFLSFYGLKRYRLEGMNYRNVVLIGLDDTSKQLADLFMQRSDLGYRFFGFFSSYTSNEDNYLGTIEDSFDYILSNKIDEIFCANSVLNGDQIRSLTKFANEHSKVIKLIPDSHDLYSKNVKAEYYDNLLVLNVKKLPLDIPTSHFIKRIFDIVFSLLIIIFIMSWLAPLLWVLIKLESNGPALFRQDREGLRGHKFTCYKFRSMKLNKLSDQIHATKNDHRITRIGGFLRRTSLDELPQFFNVLLGDMSVVGPRPHMKSLSKEYQQDIDNYIDRFAVKPGITGLAQISGYRGEVKKKSDIKNRIRLDIFYIENWSFLLDIKIILKTIYNVFTGEDKAY